MQVQFQEPAWLSLMSLWLPSTPGYFNFRSKIAVLLVSTLLTSCATMPKVSVGYYLPKSSVDVTLIQTAICTDGDIPILKNDVTVTTTYASDTTTRYPVNLNELGHWWSKANASFDYYDDGRLKGINATQAGQGSETLKALYELLTGVFGAAPTVTGGEVATLKYECNVLRGITC